MSFRSLKTSTGGIYLVLLQHLGGGQSVERPSEEREEKGGLFKDKELINRI